MINTNSKRPRRFLAELAEVQNRRFYFQFDGFESETYRKLRGEPDILEEKLRALGRLAAVVTRVPTTEWGINEHDIDRIIDFAISHRSVRGVNFQPAFHADRHTPPTTPRSEWRPHYRATGPPAHGSGTHRREMRVPRDPP
jgi:uncharacterized radical SAM superfamily Fe-S cluster-containing enzyme